MGMVLAELFQQLGSQGVLPHGFQIKNHIQYGLVGGGIQLGEEVPFIYAAQPANQIVHAILRHNTVNDGLSSIFVPRFPVSQDHDHRCQRMLGIPVQSQLGVGQGGFRVALLHGDTGGSCHGFGNGAAVPCGFAVLIVGFRRAFLCFQNQTQQIVRVAGLSVHVEFCQGVKTFPGIAFRLGQATHLIAVFCHAQQAVRVVGVAL